MRKGDDLQQFFDDLTGAVNSAVADFAAKGRTFSEGGECASLFP